jgi:hypothetical protein
MRDASFIFAGSGGVRRVYVSTLLSQNVDEVWAVLGDFHRIDRWITIIHESVPEHGDQSPTIGSIRKLTVGEDRRTTRERLVSYDASARRLTYELPDAAPLGTSHYLGTVHALPVTESGETFVEWYGQYACDDVANVPRIEAGLRGAYRAFLADLRQHLNSTA